MSQPLRKAAAVGVLALAAASAAVAPANAATVPPKTLKYTCKYPLVDKQPLEILVTSNIPSQAKTNELQPAFVVNATATAGGNTSQAITTLNAQAIDGVSQATASLHFPSGFVQEDLAVDLTVDKWVRPAGPVPNPLVLTASGSTPAVVLDEDGKTDIVLDKIALNLRALKADGTPINVKKLTTDFEGNSVEADTTPDDFSVYCKLDAGESNVIATICVSPDGQGTCDIVDPNHPPTRPEDVVAENVTKTSATLKWSASTDEDGDAITYNVYNGATKLGTTSSTSFQVSGLTKNTSYTLSIEATDGKDSSPLGTVSFKTEDDEELGVPGNFRVEGGKVCWDAVEGAVTYSAKVDGNPATVSGTCVTPGVLAPGIHTIEVSAVDAAGNQGAPGEFSFAIDEPDNQPPTAPKNLKSSNVTATSWTLSWDASTDPDGSVVGYDVYCDGIKLTSAPTTALSFTYPNAGPNSTYHCVVAAIDNDGEATNSAQLEIKTPGGGDDPTILNYTLKGSTALKTLTKGNLPLTGGIKAEPDFAAGTFTADLTLNNTSGRLIAAGFLPITAKVGFVPIGKTTGTLDDATATTPAGITTNSKVRIKVLEVKLFGAIPLAGGNNCQTKQASDINLKSTNAFDPFKGGSIAGTYKISDLNGCGPLNGLVSPLTAGGGNTIALDLTYKP